MQTYHYSLTSVTAPLLVVQGVSSDLRPIVPEPRARTIKEQKYENAETKLNYGVQIRIERELDDLKNDCVARLVKYIESCNVRKQAWWPNQDTDQSQKVHHHQQQQQQQQQQSQQSLSKDDQKQQKQRFVSKQLTSLGNGSHNFKGMWFNVKYSDKQYEMIVNGSNSSLSPYNAKGDFYGSLLPLQWMDKYYDYIPSVFITFYEISNDEKWDDLLINEINRVKFKFSNTMIKFVVVLIDLNPQLTKNSRLQLIINKINMNNNSLFIINGLNDEISKREQLSFVKKLLIGLKQYSNDFFDIQISKLKKREIKDDQYNEKFFSTRNLIKMAMFEQFKNINDYSTKLLEYAYDRLLQILRTIDYKSQETAYLETRQWLDIICLNIVRSCITLGDVNIAFRKFIFHVQKIRELDFKNLTFDWLSNQYTWLGELIENINENIILYDSTILPTLGLKEIKFNSYNMPQNGFIFLQAANFRDKCLKYENNDVDNRILLLTASLDSFNMSKNCRFSRIESKIYILLGDVYYNMQNYSMAVNNYLAGISCYKRESYLFIINIILQKILNCYIELFKIREACGIYIELCCLSTESILNKIPNHKEFLNNIKEKIISLDLINDDSQLNLINNVDDNEEDEDIETYEDKDDENDNITFIKINSIFDVELGIKKYKNLMNEGVNIQIIFKCKGDSMIENLKIKDIKINMGENGNFKIIKIEDSNKKENGNIREIECISDSIKENIKSSLIFKNSEENISYKKLILQLHVQSKKIGKFNISNIKINGVLNDFKFKTIINNNEFNSNYANINNNNKFFKWYNKNKSNDFDIIQIQQPRNSFEILPKIPNIKCILKYNEIGFNGRSLPIKLKFINKDSDSIVKIHVKGSGKFNKKEKEILVKWENDKDYYSSDKLLNPNEEILIDCLVKIPQIEGLSMNLIEEEGGGGVEGEEGSINLKNNCEIKFNIIYEITNENNIKIDLIKEAKIKIVEMIEWVTKLRPELNIKFPNIFEINEEEGINIIDRENNNNNNTNNNNTNINLPIHTRRWLFKLNLKNISYNDLIIENKKFLINGPKGIKLILNIIDDEEEKNREKNNKDILKTLGNKEIKILVDISNNNEKIMRSIPIDIKCIINYYTIGGDDCDGILQQYKIDMFKGNLPHYDPRIIVLIDKIEHEIDNNNNNNNTILDIKYILENPTEHIFQYQTNLNNIENVEILNYLKNMKINLMPFMQESIKLKYKINLQNGSGVDRDQNEIELPEFTFYDRKFQVFVKISSADDRLRFIDGHLFFSM
jgi:hypothetical protein